MKLILVPTPIILKLINSGAIPVFSTAELKLMDNRICCPYARRNDERGPEVCGFFVEPPVVGQPHCRLGDGRPCAFHEERDTEVWQRIQEQNELAAKYYPQEANHD